MVQAANATPSSAAEQASRLNQAQALLSASMRQGFSYTGKTTYLQAVQQQPGLIQAWELTEGDAWAPDLARRRNEIRLELAWRLQDSGKMQAAWPGLMALGGHYDLREAVHGLFIAMHLGQWQVAESIGQALKKGGGNLDGFHAAALESLTTFDYAAIFDLIGATKDLPLQWTLADRSFRITHVRVRISKLESHSSSGKALVESLSKGMATLKVDQEGWIPREDPIVELLQVGAGAHWVETPMQPPVSGFIGPDRLMLRGGSSSGEGSAVTTFDLHRSAENPRRWAGLSRMDVFQAADHPGSIPSASVILDYQWEMEPIPQGPVQNSPKEPDSKP